MRTRQAGLSLVELVVVIALTAIVASFGVTMLAAPAQTLELANGRIQLAAEAGQALELLARDLRQAYPGSVRYRMASGVLAIELLRISDSGAALPDSLASAAAQRLDLGAPESSFETLGNLPATTVPLTTRQLRLAVYDPAAAANPYAPGGPLTAAGTRIRITAGSAAAQSRFTLTPAATFGGIGMRRRIFLLSGAVSYLCDPVSGNLRRYSGYQLAASQSLRDTAGELLAAGAAAATVATRVTQCQFSQQSQPAAAQSTASVALQLTRGNEAVHVAQTVVIDDAG